jgi:hypothetical protein
MHRHLARIVAAVALALAASVVAQAQKYPTRPVRA